MRKERNHDYTLAANNFYAEATNFFLDESKTTTISSDDKLASTVDSNKTYRMRIRLQSNSKVDFPLYNRASAFGPPVDGGLVADEMKDYLPNSMPLKSFNTWGFSPFTPPHYGGFAEVEYTFSPHVTESYSSIEQVIARIAADDAFAERGPTVKYNRFTKLTGSGYFRDGYGGFTNNSMAANDARIATSSLNKVHAMQISASFSGIALEEANLVPTFRLGESGDEVLRNSWVIQSRFETPSLDFRPASASAPRPAGLTTTKGMWHQLGTKPAAGPSVTILGPRNPKDGDLSKLLNMHVVSDGKSKAKKSTTIGNIAQNRTIKEAIVAIPFIVRNNERRFFTLPKSEVYKAVQIAGYPEYKKEYLENIERQKGSELSVRQTVQSMVNKMFNYVFPPRMNFIKYNSEGENFINPFVMYIFEFKHKLSSDDLSYIWQNLTPDIGLDNFHNSEKDDIHAESTVSHSLFGADGIMKDRLNEEVKWMVFKVKQKAEVSYFKKMERDRYPSGHPEKNKKIEDVFEYGYNWPYDYFSLVELVKLDAEVGFSANAGPSEASMRRLISPPARDGE